MVVPIIICTFAGSNSNMEATQDIKDKVAYIIAVISEFATRHSLSTAQAYRYLDRYGGLEFVTRHYNVEHTLSFEEVVDDLTGYCHRKGGGLL